MNRNIIKTFFAGRAHALTPKSASLLLLAAGGLTLSAWAASSLLPGRSGARTPCRVIGFYENGMLERIPYLARGPFVNGYVSSGWGWRFHPLLQRIAFHAGTDVAAPAGSPIYASSDGQVKEARWTTLSGNWLLVNYGRGIDVGYSHLQAFEPGIRAGARVKRGDTLAKVGSTGLSTGPHVDVRMYISGTQVQPACSCKPLARIAERGIRVRKGEN